MTGVIMALFLGYAGAYRFYKRQTALGFLYLFTGGLFGIGWLVDIIYALIEYAPDKAKIQTTNNLPAYMTISQDRYMEPKANFTPNYKYQKHYIVYDFETTGTDPYNCEIIEIGAIKVDDGKIIDRFQSLIKPFKPIPADATKVNNITNDMVKDAPTAETIFPKFLEFIGDSKLVGYNINSFDHIILKRYAAGICDKPIENTITDVYLLSRRNLDLNKYTLTAVAEHLNVKISNAHRSIGDCETTFECFKKIQEIIREGNK